MQLEGNNVETMINDKEDEVIENVFQPFRCLCG